MTQLKALQSFSGPDGVHTKDDTFNAAPERVQFLVDGGYAELIPAPEEPEAPARTARKK